MENDGVLLGGTVLVTQIFCGPSAPQVPTPMRFEEHSIEPSMYSKLSTRISSTH